MLNQNAPQNSDVITNYQNENVDQNPPQNYPFKCFPYVIPGTDDNLLENLIKNASGALNFLEHTIPYDTQVYLALTQYEDLLQSVSKRVFKFFSNPIMEVNHTMSNVDRLMLRLIKRYFDRKLPDLKQQQLFIFSICPV